MEEIVFWKEVDVKDATNSIKISDEVFGGIVFVKRVVIPILSDQEIKKLADKIDDFFVERCGCPSSGSSNNYNEFKEILKSFIRSQLI